MVWITGVTAALGLTLRDLMKTRNKRQGQIPHSNGTSDFGNPLWIEYLDAILEDEIPDYDLRDFQSKIVFVTGIYFFKEKKVK